MVRAGFMFFILLASLIFGLGTAYRLVDRGLDIGVLRSGPWVANLRAANDPDPYTRAHLAKTGEVALALAEGIRLRAATDDDGRALNGRCRYTMSGNTPQSRFWSVTATSRGGEVFENPFNRSSFTSAEMLRNSDASWKIAFAATVEPGNWLAVPEDQNFFIVLYLYEPAILGGTANIERDRLPHIKRESCA